MTAQSDGPISRLHGFFVHTVFLIRGPYTRIFNRLLRALPEFCTVHSSDIHSLSRWSLSGTTLIFYQDYPHRYHFPRP